MHPSLGKLTRDAAELLRRYGATLYLEFLAAGIAVVTLHILLAPGTLRRILTGAEGVNAMAIFFDPFVQLQEVLFVVVAAAGMLRIWHDISGDDGRAALRANLVPLVVLNFLAGFAFYTGMLMLILPGFLVAAATTALIPVVAVEGLGWEALPRALALARRGLLRLTVLWALILVPWIGVSAMTSPAAAAVPDMTDMQLWLWMLGDEIVASAFTTFSVCMMFAAYLQLSAPDRDLPDVFR